MDEQNNNLLLPETSVENRNILSWILHYKTLGISVLLLVIALVALILVNVFHNPSTKTTASSSPKVSNSLIKTWRKNYGNLLVTLDNDINEVNAQVANQSYAGQETACQQLEADANTSANAPAIPNTTIDAQFRSGISDLQQAAQSCISGTQIYLNQADNYYPEIELQAGNELNTFANDLQLGTTQIQNTSTAIKALSN